MFSAEAILDLYKTVENSLQQNIRVCECWTRMPGYMSQELAERRRQLVVVLKQWPTLHQTHCYVQGSCLICGVKRAGN